jgi:anti-anti-sigma factor
VSSRGKEVPLSGNGERDRPDGIPVDDGDSVREARPQKPRPVIWRAGGQPRLRVQVIKQTAIVRFASCDILCGGKTVREVVDRLDHLARAEGHRRLLLNLAGVRYLSVEVLEALAALQEGIDRRGGRVQICGLNPLIRDLLRASHLDQVFDVCDDEPGALGLLIR